MILVHTFRFCSRQLKLQLHPTSGRSLPTYCGDLAVNIYDLGADWRNDNRRDDHGRSDNRNADPDTDRRPPRNAGVTHWSKRAPDDRMSLRHERSRPGYGHILASEEARNSGTNGQSSSQNSHRCSIHFFPPAATPCGTSSKFVSAFNATLFAPGGGVNAKASEPACTSIFQSLIRREYVGAAPTPLLVITYLRGIGWEPSSIQICQSTSIFRKARCSHSTPSITPRPMCFASMTPAIKSSKTCVPKMSAPGADTMSMLRNLPTS